MPFARAGCRFVISGCGGVVGGFMWALGFDDAVGDAFESAYVAIVVKFGFFGHTSPVP